MKNVLINFSSIWKHSVHFLSNIAQLKTVRVRKFYPSSLKNDYLTLKIIEERIFSFNLISRLLISIQICLTQNTHSYTHKYLLLLCIENELKKANYFKKNKVFKYIIYIVSCFNIFAFIRVHAFKVWGNREMHTHRNETKRNSFINHHHHHHHHNRMYIFSYSLSLFHFFRYYFIFESDCKTSRFFYAILIIFIFFFFKIKSTCMHRSKFQKRCSKFFTYNFVFWTLTDLKTMDQVKKNLRSFLNGLSVSLIVINRNYNNNNKFHIFYMSIMSRHHNPSLYAYSFYVHFI